MIKYHVVIQSWNISLKFVKPRLLWAMAETKCAIVSWKSTFKQTNEVVSCYLKMNFLIKIMKPF